MGWPEKAVENSPQLKRGQVWCLNCGMTRQVDSGECIRTGWPKCCNQTMSIDSPAERKYFAGQTGGNNL